MRSTVAIMATFGALSGCGLATSGLGLDQGSADASALDSQLPPLDATVGDGADPPEQDASTLEAAASVEGGDGATTGVDVVAIDAGDACAETSDASAIATIPPWPGPPPPKIDGDLSEWPCEGRVSFTGANAAYVKNSAHPLGAEVELAYDKSNVYVAIHVTDASVTGNDPVNPYNNDSVEVYVSGDATLNGDYDTMTHQYVTDYTGNTVDYGPSHGGGLPDGTHAHFNAAAKTAPGGWSFEAAIGWQALLKPPGTFGPGTNLALDFEVNDGDGFSQVASLVLTLAPAQPGCTCTQACCCGMTTDLPSCDSIRIPRVTLQ